MTRIPPMVRFPQPAPLNTPVTKYASTAPRTIGVIATVYMGGLIHISHSFTFDGGLGASLLSTGVSKGLGALDASPAEDAAFAQY